MSNVYRFEKVCNTFVYVTLTHFNSSWSWNQWKSTETRYADREWDDDEKAAFEDAVLTHGAELRTVRDEVGTRTIYEVVRYYGHWKKYIYIHVTFPVLTPTTARNLAKRTAVGIYLAPRKRHLRLRTPSPLRMTLTRKAPLYVHRVRLMHRAGHVEHATPSFGGRRQRACRRPCCATRAASLGVNTRI
jgi:hypothetical protein